MTDREKAIVMAYTGYAMLVGDKLGVFYQYVQEKLGRSVMTHELACEEVQAAIKEAAKEDFIAIAESAPTVNRKHKPLQISSGLTYCGACRRYLPRPSTVCKTPWNYCAWCGSEIDWTGIEPVDIGPWLYRAGTEAKDDAID